MAWKMARSYNFSVISAKPSDMRDEQVNVGIVIYAPSGPDVRLPELRKLTHLTGHKWTGVADAYVSAITKSSKSSISPSSTEVGVFGLGKVGQFLAETPEQYEAAIKKILTYFVDKPSLSRAEKQLKINSEISKVLKLKGVLGSAGQSIDDGMVISKFVISEEKDMVADFAYKSRGLKIVSTLDLRGVNSAHSRACVKGVVLHFAKRAFANENVTPFSVYAASPSEAETHRGEIEIMRDFADGNVFNWMDAQDRRRFQAALY
jgi:hypothetical protein